MKAALMRWLSMTLLAAVYGSATVISRVINRRGEGRRRRTNRLLAIATFHNPNWFQAHLTPLVRSGMGEIVLVCDQVVEPMAGVRYACPPTWLGRLVSRAVAKFLWAIVCGVRYRPDLYIGYHIFPAAVSALIVARLLNRPACFQDTSGPPALEGGGWRADNSVLSALGRPSPFIERLALAVVREFDLIVVRGVNAAEFITRRAGYRRRLATITGSVALQQTRRPFAEREIDLVFVGRLSARKRVDRFIAVAAGVAARMPGLRAAIIGEGPLESELRRQAASMGMGDRIEFLGQLAEPPQKLARAKLFVLTSRSEGLSIALIEAMGCGAVPVISDVGEARDLVQDGVNGYVIGQDAIEHFCERIVQLLSNPAHWEQCSRSAAWVVARSYTTDAVADQWRRQLTALLRNGAVGRPRASADAGSDLRPASPPPDASPSEPIGRVPRHIQ